MPIYEYRCSACGAVEERIRPVGDPGKDLRCEVCGAGKLERIPSTFAAASGGKSPAAGACGPGGFS